MTTEELEQIKRRAASCYAGTAWRGAISDVGKLIDALEASQLQTHEYKTALEQISTLAIEFGCGCESMQRTAQRALMHTEKKEGA